MRLGISALFLARHTVNSTSRYVQYEEKSDWLYCEVPGTQGAFLNGALERRNTIYWGLIGVAFEPSKYEIKALRIY